MFYDDVFTVHPRWLDQFLPRYKAEIGLPFWCYSYPTTHDRELLQKLKDAGCVAITMGVQSGSERILREYFNRPTKSERVIAAAEEIGMDAVQGDQQQALGRGRGWKARACAEQHEQRKQETAKGGHRTIIGTGIGQRSLDGCGIACVNTLTAV